MTVGKGFSGGCGFGLVANLLFSLSLSLFLRISLSQTRDFPQNIVSRNTVERKRETTSTRLLHIVPVVFDPHTHTHDAIVFRVYPSTVYVVIFYYIYSKGYAKTFFFLLLFPGGGAKTMGNISRNCLPYIR